MYWVLYAMFMFHPQNDVAWRITNNYEFGNFVECQEFYYENHDKLVDSLKSYMVKSFGVVNDKYTLMEIGCVTHNGSDPIITKRIPLSSLDTIKEFIIDKVDA